MFIILFILIKYLTRNFKRKNWREKNISSAGSWTHEIDYFQAGYYSRMEACYIELILEVSAMIFCYVMKTWIISSLRCRNYWREDYVRKYRMLSLVERWVEGRKIGHMVLRPYDSVKLTRNPKIRMGMIPFCHIMAD